MHKRIPISCVDYWGTVFYVVMMLANYDTPLIREETRPLMCMVEQQWGSEEVRPLALPSTLHDLPPVALLLAEARKIEYLGFAFLGAGVFKVRTIRL